MSRQASLAVENAVASPVGVEPDGYPGLILFSLRHSALFVLSVMSKWDDMLAEFRALGGIAENLCLKNGAFGRGLFPLDPSKPYTLHIPASLLIDINHVEFENDVFRVGPKAQIGERARSFLEGYERDFSWGVANQEVRDVLQMLYEAPQEIRELMRSPFNVDSWLVEPTDPTAVQSRYLASRALTFKPGIDVVIPIVELANYGHATRYKIDENGAGLEGKTDGEILVHYRPDDPLGIFVGWGFVSENEPFACSLSLGVDKKGPPIRIMRKEVNLDLRPKPFMPDVTHEGDTLVLSFLMLGNRNNPQLPRAIFDRIMREAGRAHAVEMFDFIQHINRLQWLKLMKASESAAVPLGQLLRNLARSQLEAMSYNVGGLQF
jgi:hypothetical protein